jgi:hypothetical protein
MKHSALWSGEETPQLSLRWHHSLVKCFPVSWGPSSVLLVDFPAHGRAANADQYCATLERLARGHQDKTSGLITDSVILHVITPDRQHSTTDSELAAKVRFENAGPSPAQSEFGTQRFLVFSPFWNSTWQATLSTAMKTSYALPSHDRHNWNVRSTRSGCSNLSQSVTSALAIKMTVDKQSTNDTCIALSVRALKPYLSFMATVNLCSALYIFFYLQCDVKFIWSCIENLCALRIALSRCSYVINQPIWRPSSKNQEKWMMYPSLSNNMFQKLLLRGR